MTAALLVDRMMEPENFVLMLDENTFGPANAAVTSVRVRVGQAGSQPASQTSTRCSAAGRCREMAGQGRGGVFSVDSK